MTGSRTVEVGGVAVLLLDELEEIPHEQEDFVLVCGAHAGIGNARRVLRRPPRLAVFHDAGVGKDRSGVAGLELLDAFSIPAVAVSHESARIGDASDALENGVISECNSQARGIGAVNGETVRSLLAKLKP